MDDGVAPRHPRTWSPTSSSSVSLGQFFTRFGGIFYFYLLTCGSRSLVPGTQNEIVVSWITLWEMNKVYWLDFTLDLRSCCLPQVRAEACISLQSSWERSKVRRSVRTTFGELKVQLKMNHSSSNSPKYVRRTNIRPVKNGLNGVEW